MTTAYNGEVLLSDVWNYYDLVVFVTRDQALHAKDSLMTRKARRVACIWKYMRDITPLTFSSGEFSIDESARYLENEECAFLESFVLDSILLSTFIIKLTDAHKTSVGWEMHPLFADFMLYKRSLTTPIVEEQSVGIFAKIGRFFGDRI